jgi:hypothetical protein
VLLAGFFSNEIRAHDRINGHVCPRLCVNARLGICSNYSAFLPSLLIDGLHDSVLAALEKQYFLNENIRNSGYVPVAATAGL